MLCLAALTGCDDQPSSTNDAIDPGTGGKLVFEVTGEGESARFVDPAKNAIHPVAGRSAFPEAGENLTEPIAPKRLSEDNIFRPAIAPEDIPDIVPWDQAKKYVGYEVTVEGRIVTVGRSNDGNIHFLNFHEDWRGKFYMVIFDDLAKTLDTPVESLFKDKLIRVKGTVDTHNGKPQMKIRSMDQVEFVE